MTDLRLNWRRAGLACSALVATAGMTAPPVGASIIEYPLDPSATAVARAMAVDPSVVRRAVFSAIPPGSKPAAVSTTRLAGFPRPFSGRSYAILTTGNARLADDPNYAPATRARPPGGHRSAARATSTIMRIDLRIPKGANCLSFRFRFLSEEYPEFVGDDFNDAFIAELDASNWTAATKTDPSDQGAAQLRARRRAGSRSGSTVRGRPR